MLPAFKHLLFRHHFTISFLLVIIVVALYALFKNFQSIEFLLGGLGGAIAISYFAFQHGLEERKFLRELFVEFNRRYNALNDPLYDIRCGTGALSAGEKKVLADYFNLCAEEWFYFRDGIVPPPIWKSWLNGMKQYYEVERIRQFWDQELATNSYYEFRFEG